MDGGLKKMFGKFWGDHMNGKLIELMRLISDDNEDIMIKTLPFLKKDNYGSPQFLMSDKPSEKCIKQIEELYSIKFFRNDNAEDEYKYLVTLETLQYAYEQESHWTISNKTPLSKNVTGNKWDFDGYFYITDKLNDYRRIAVIPYSANAYSLDGGYNLSEPEALEITKAIVKRLNNGDLI